ncbi:hypothetical protein PSQ40_06990 [Curvibacter sp. HBC61]|uniref:N-acyl amino acid synthase FeeM catalytic core domain-containing protein n=1 Tax=Curvibacter cyanobacteriorum TaxID=3026422 RepID=A0ABT5MZU7_9BURK|nr:hypothetical protein [Curvibacter sp. HBC61]MDD0838312.1 hypothetical protein [Curvibacter sp. HBC61]
MAAVMTPFLDSDIRLTPPRAGQQASLSQGKDGLVEERLPFTVRLVSSERQLAKAIAIRHAAYARHLPEFAESLKQAERSDFSDDSVILLAESRLDGSPLGTMRIQTNRHEPLPLEQSVALPDWLRHGGVLAEAVRLGVTEGVQGLLVKTVLFKAFFQYCERFGIDWMVIAGRSPLDRQYRRLMFREVYPELGPVPLRHAGNIPHRVMCFEVGTARTLPNAEQHSFYDFLFRTHHPEIQLDDVPLTSRASPMPMHLAPRGPVSVGVRLQ